MDDVTHRLNELEVRYMHQEQLIDELNTVIVECNQRLARLERDVDRYRAMLQSLAPTLTESPDE